MSLMSVFRVASTGVSAQAQRLNAVASNMANAESAAAPNTQPYRAKQVLFETMTPAESDPVSSGVQVSNVIEDSSPGRRILQPGHPYADAEGYVQYSNVNVVDEMVNMISAARAYQNNVEIMNTAKSLMQKTLNIGS